MRRARRLARGWPQRIIATALRTAPPLLLASALSGCSGPQIVCDYGASYCRGGPYKVSVGGRVISRHEGIDFAGHVGAPVISASYGRVVRTQEVGGCGGTVAVQTELTDRTFGAPNPIYLRYHHVVPAKGLRIDQEVVPGQLLGTMQDPFEIPGRGNCIIEPHLNFSLSLTPDYDAGHRSPHAFWLNGRLTCFRPGMTVPRDRFVSPIPCGDK